MKKNYLWIIIIIVIIIIASFFIFKEKKEVVEEVEKIKLEFFQSKEEVVDLFDELIVKFEKEHPNIDIEQNNVPAAGVVLKARLVKNDMPDILAIGGDFAYGEIARAGVLVDFSNDPILEKVHEAYVEMIDKIAKTETKNGIPYAANANTVLYNVKKFKDLGIDAPKTWDEFIATCEKIKASGEVPLYLTFKDTWTIMVPFNSIVANLQGDDFIEKRMKNETSFAERYGEIAEKLMVLLDYGHDDNFGRGYDDGNTSFANGKSFMLIQGIWAISSVKKANPDIEIGVFALPVRDKYEDNRLVSGVDTVLGISNSTKYPEAAKEFVQFLIKKENIQYYINQERLYSCVKGVFQEDPDLVGIKEYFETGRITSFPDHYYPPGMGVSNLAQEFLLKKDVNEFLKTLDSEWDKVVSR
jgi:raffinose/stachyose/melibiose transport system substrate-binding protein